MAHTILTAALASIGAASNTLMRIQSRAEAYHSSSSDPRYLPEHLQRDIGLIQGRAFGEEIPDHSGRPREQSQHWTDFVVTPHAA